MKKLIILSILFVFIGFAGNSQRFSELSFKTIKGDSVLLSSYSGKKTLFFILPVNRNDSNFKQLQNFQNRYRDSVKIIGILSFEDGYTAKNASALQDMYSKMDIVITEGFYIKKTAGEKQSSLMKWLTDKNKNRHFDMDATGIGHKFFVNEQGRLFAVMPPQTPLSAPIIDRIIHTPVVHPGNRN